MALDGNRLGTAIADAIKASVPPPGSKITDAQLETMWQLVGTEIVNEITNNAEVATTTTGTVTTGPGAGGSTSGSGMGDVS
jgi:hypothetical protein